jgi:hypothetical protein
MWSEVWRWWTSLWADPKIFGAAAGALFTGIALLLLREGWQHRSTQSTRRRDLAKSRLDALYGPLYVFYREADAHFETWRRANPGTQLKKQPFFSKRGEGFVKDMFETKSSYASQALIVQWVELQSAADHEEERERRASFIETVVREYQGLRRELELDYDKGELFSGEFSSSAISFDPSKLGVDKSCTRNGGEG